MNVIVPAYRAAQWIGTALDSVLAQTFTDYDITVVDDGSPDTEELRRVLEPYWHRIRYIRQENQGLSGARNTGILASRGKYIAPLDADDIWEPGHLAAQVAVLEADPSVDVVYADARVFGAGLNAGRTLMELVPYDSEITFERLLTRQCIVPICVSVARRESLLRVGLFDPALRRAEDFDLWLRLLKQGGRITYQRQVLGRYRRHAGSLSSDPVVMIEGVLRVLAKAAQYPGITPAERQLIERQRTAECATMELHKGKKRFADGDTKAAAGHLTLANTYYRSTKLAVVVMLLRSAPKVVQALSHFRNRFIYRLNTPA